jgi:mono/diheme cytochrome c family protein
VAWRTIALPDGRILMSHQRQLKTVLDAMQGGYGRGCGGPIEAAITVMQPGQAPFAVSPTVGGALPVDVALNRSGDTLAFAIAGSKSIQLVPFSALATPDGDNCGGDGGGGTNGGSGMGGGGVPVPDIAAPDPGSPANGLDDELGAPSSVAYKANNELLVFYPEYPAIVVHSGADGSNRRMIILTGNIGYDSGRALFHTQTGVGLACASCHPEGRDDGLVWNFADVGLRRTQSLAGHILARAPYHWGGDLADIPTLMNSVFTVRMAGGDVTHSQAVSLGPWLDRVPAARPSQSVDAAAAARGQAIFESTAQNCTSCHNGTLFTNKLLVDVGTGGMFKVPSLLGVSNRAPYMHDGCAATLADRFTAPCGGGEAHGHTAALSVSQIGDLVSYLETL